MQIKVTWRTIKPYYYLKTIYDVEIGSVFEDIRCGGSVKEYRAYIFNPNEEFECEGVGIFSDLKEAKKAVEEKVS